MKTLYLIRHAKSSWDDPSLDDFDRPLNGRGEKDAPRMGKRLKKEGIFPDLMLSSTANRALTTAHAIARALDYPFARIQESDALYHAYPQAILKEIQAIPDTVSTLFVYGHNPGLTDFANHICASYIDNIVTCGIYALELPLQNWKQFSLQTKARLLFYDYPKKK